jgi:hypothetical protein
MFPSIRRASFDSSYTGYIDEGFRHELKYTLSPCEAARFRDLCEGFMERDGNAGESGEYKVRSHYFDTPHFGDFTDKRDGVYERQKYRIRTYGDSGFYRLEKKIKRGSLNMKKSGRISATDADALVRGSTNLKTGDEGADAIISEMWLKGYRYSVYTEYIREAFVMRELDLRITFDRGIRFLHGNRSLYETAPCAIPAFHGGEVVLEVKYKDALPKWLDRAVYRMAPEESSISKYEKSLGHIIM